jgi:hypothetical protein
MTLSLVLKLKIILNPEILEVMKTGLSNQFADTSMKLMYSGKVSD